MTVYGTKIMMKDEQLTKIITVPIFMGLISTYRIYCNSCFKIVLGPL